MNNKSIIKPEWIPAAYSGVDETAKVKAVGNVDGVPFYKRLRKSNSKEIQKKVSKTYICFVTL